MEIQEIEITIDKKGQVVLHVRGVKGKACLDLTNQLEKLLGGQVVERKMTPDSNEDPDLPVGQDLNIRPGA
jgi:hypothetical protein